MINEKSPNKVLATKFIQNYLMQPENLKIINNDVPLGVPANKEFYMELAAQDERIKASMANIEVGSPIPSVPQIDQFWLVMGSALESFTRSQNPRGIQETLNDVAEQIVDIISFSR